MSVVCYDDNGSTQLFLGCANPQNFDAMEITVFVAATMPSPWQLIEHSAVHLVT